MEENKNNKSNKNVPDNYYSSLNKFIALLWVMFFIFVIIMPNVSLTSNQSVTNKYETVTVETLKSECILTCLGYNPIFEEDGTKNYEVRFRVSLIDSMVKCIVPAKEIDELHNIEENAKYKGTVEIGYCKEYIEQLNNLDMLEEKDTFKSFLFSHSELYEIIDLKFMYSDCLINEYSVSQATEKLEKTYLKNE